MPAQNYGTLKWLQSIPEMFSGLDVPIVVGGNQKKCRVLHDWQRK